MTPHAPGGDAPVALVTGAAARIGAAIARSLHARGCNILLHFNHSQERALALAMILNTERERSVHCLQADLLDPAQLANLAQGALAHWGRLDLLVNNAACFHPTPLSAGTETDWQQLMGCNAKAPWLLTRQLAPALTEAGGAIVNLVDIYAGRPPPDYHLYAMSKAALASLTRSLAREMAPRVRVNAVAPGAILWPEPGKDGQEDLADESHRHRVIAQSCLKRQGSPEDIAEAVAFLALDASYMTGQTLVVDGGRSLFL